MWFRRFGVIGIAAAGMACSDATAPDELSIAFEGRIERGSVVTATVRDGGDIVPPEFVTWSMDPALAVSVLSGGRLRLGTAGTVTLRAEVGGENGQRIGTIALDVALPPWIVFDRSVDGNRDIYRARLDGGDLARMTTHTVDDVGPTAARGSVVFTSFRDGNAELYTVPFDGGAPVRLTDTPDDEIQPALFSGGGLLAYAANPSGVFKLWTSNADGSDAHERTTAFGTGGSVEGSPSWAPSGEELVFMSTTNGTADLFTFESLGGSAHELLSQNTAEVEPAWSPDGASVVFASNSSGDTELFLLDVSSSNVTRLTIREGPDGEAAWLDDGRIVFTRWEDGTPSLAWLDPDAPGEVFGIDLGAGIARRASGVPGE